MNKGASLNLDILCACSPVPQHFIYLSLLMSGHLGSLPVSGWWWAVSAWLEFSVVCYLIVCDMWVPALRSSAWIIEQVLLDWPDGDLEQLHSVRGAQSATESFSLWAVRYRGMIGGYYWEHINKSLVTTSSRAGLAENKNWKGFGGIFIACTVHSGGPHFNGCLFLILHCCCRWLSNTERAKQFPVHVWRVLQASGG